MNLFRALQSHYVSERNMYCFRSGCWRQGVEISFGVLGSSLPDLEEEGLEGGGLVSGSLISRVIGRRLICQVKIGA